MGMRVESWVEEDIKRETCKKLEKGYEGEVWIEVAMKRKTCEKVEKEIARKKEQVLERKRYESWLKSMSGKR